jgi:hypothetical protein
MVKNSDDKNTGLELTAKYVNVLVALGNLVTMAYHAGPQLAQYIQHLLPPAK